MFNLFYSLLFRRVFPFRLQFRLFVRVAYTTKKCFYCSSVAIVKNGHKGHIQRYLCELCGKSFIFRKAVDTEALWRDCVFVRQTVFQLGER